MTLKCSICGDDANAGIDGGKLCTPLCDRCSRFFLCGVHFGSLIKNFHCQGEMDAAMDGVLIAMSDMGILPSEAVMPVEALSADGYCQRIDISFSEDGRDVE